MTISGSNLGNGSDVYNVTVGGVPAVIVNQTGAMVVVIVAPSPVTGTAAIVVSSHSFGDTVSSVPYTVNPPAAIHSIIPTNVTLSHSEVVSITITGVSLGTGNDVSLVRVAGEVATVVSQSSSVLVVNVSASALISGPVEVVSAAYGTVVGPVFAFVAGMLFDSCDSPPTSGD